jgi:hypothetical protein
MVGLDDAAIFSGDNETLTAYVADGFVAPSGRNFGLEAPIGRAQVHVVPVGTSRNHPWHDGALLCGDTLQYSY